MKNSLLFALVGSLLLSACSQPKPGLSASAPPTELTARAWKAAWSPNGRQLVYTRAQDGLEILELRTDRRQLVSAEGKDPAWSPDGRWIAFVRGASPRAIHGGDGLSDRR